MKMSASAFPASSRCKTSICVVMPGEIHGLVGENGAGKSTLIKILSGAYQADAGEIEIDGESISRPTPLQMLELGIAVIYQEMMLAPHLSVAENLFLGRLPKTRFGLVDWRETHRRSAEVLARLGFALDPTARVSDLSVAQRQMVEIAGALSRNARIVVLDEPSAVLGGAELEKLFEIIRRLAREGVSFIYISHRLQEVFAICDRVTVLRDGLVVGTSATAELDSQTLISMMVGRRSPTSTRSATAGSAKPCWPSRADPQRRACRHRSRRPTGRDPRHLRPGGIRPHRTAAGAHRRRSVRMPELSACAANRSA